MNILRISINNELVKAINCNCLTRKLQPTFKLIAILTVNSNCKDCIAIKTESCFSFNGTLLKKFVNYQMKNKIEY